MIPLPGAQVLPASGSGILPRMDFVRVSRVATISGHHGAWEEVGRFVYESATVMRPLSKDSANCLYDYTMYSISLSQTATIFLHRTKGGRGHGTLTGVSSRGHGTLTGISSGFSQPAVRCSGLIAHGCGGGVRVQARKGLATRFGLQPLVTSSLLALPSGYFKVTSAPACVPSPLLCR